MKTILVLLSVSLGLFPLSADVIEKKDKTPASSAISPSDGIARQIASVRKQLGVGAQSGQDNFFSVPWPRSLPLANAPAPVPASSATCDPLPSERSAKLIAQAAKDSGVQADLLKAVIDKESGFRPCAVSGKGAQGLMQIMPATAEELGLHDPFDPEQNVSAGSKYLKTLIDKFGGDLKLALSAYNAGLSKVTPGGGIPDIQETQDYVRDILSKVTPIAPAPQ